MAPRKKKLAEPAKSLVQIGPSTADFDEVLSLISAARTRAFAAVNHELVGLYWQLGEYISRKLESAPGEKASCNNWPIISLSIIPTLRVLHVPICSECGSVMKRTKTTKKSHRW